MKANKLKHRNEQSWSPLFTSEEVALVQYRLWRNYYRTLSGQFSNGPGKFFMDNLSKYLGHASPSTSACFESNHSNTSGGFGSIGEKDTQAGSSMVTPIVVRKYTIRSSPSPSHQSNMKCICLLPIYVRSSRLSTRLTSKCGADAGIMELQTKVHARVEYKPQAHTLSHPY